MTARCDVRDVYRSLIEILCLSVQRVCLKDDVNVITKQPALAAIMAKALQEFTAVLEQEYADEGDLLSDSSSRKHLLPRPTLIRNMVYKPQEINLAAAQSMSHSEIIYATHFPLSGCRPASFMMTKILLQGCFVLCMSNRALWHLLQRLGFPEVALR